MVKNKSILLDKYCFWIRDWSANGIIIQHKIIRNRGIFSYERYLFLQQEDFQEFNLLGQNFSHWVDCLFLDWTRPGRNWSEWKWRLFQIKGENQFWHYFRVSDNIVHLIFKWASNIQEQLFRRSRWCNLWNLGENWFGRRIEKWQFLNL